MLRLLTSLSSASLSGVSSTFFSSSTSSFLLAFHSAMADVVDSL